MRHRGRARVRRQGRRTREQIAGAHASRGAGFDAVAAKTGRYSAIGYRKRKSAICEGSVRSGPTKTDNAVSFAPPLCCPKSLTNNERAVEKEGAALVSVL